MTKSDIEQLNDLTYWLSQLPPEEYHLLDGLHLETLDFFAGVRDERAKKRRKGPPWQYLSASRWSSAGSVLAGTSTRLPISGTRASPEARCRGTAFRCGAGEARSSDRWLT